MGNGVLNVSVNEHLRDLRERFIPKHTMPSNCVLLFEGNLTTRLYPAPATIASPLPCGTRIATMIKKQVGHAFVPCIRNNVARLMNRSCKERLGFVHPLTFNTAQIIVHAYEAPLV